MEHLLSTDARLNLTAFLRLYHEQHLLAAALEPGYPAETVARALTMWIAWLVSGLGGSDPCNKADVEEGSNMNPLNSGTKDSSFYALTSSLHKDTSFTTPLGLSRTYHSIQRISKSMRIQDRSSLISSRNPEESRSTYTGGKSFSARRSWRTRRYFVSSVRRTLERRYRTWLRLLWR